MLVHASLNESFLYCVIILDVFLFEVKMWFKKKKVEKAHILIFDWLIFEKDKVLRDAFSTFFSNYKVSKLSRSIINPGTTDIIDSHGAL